MVILNVSLKIETDKDLVVGGVLLNKALVMLIMKTVISISEKKK